MTEILLLTNNLKPNMLLSQVDDDTYVRPSMVLSLVLPPTTNHRQLSTTANHLSAGSQSDSARPGAAQPPADDVVVSPGPKSGLYVGRKAGRDSADAAHALAAGAQWPDGFHPIRNPQSK